MKSHHAVFLIGIFVFLIGIFVLMTPLLIQNVFVSSVDITTDRQTYAYGDYLTFTIEVSEITGDNAILHIKDQNNTSSPINIPITKLKTNITTPQPFDSIVYKIGRYVLEIEYNGNKDQTEFLLIESNKIVIPSWVKDLGSYWVQGQIDDKTFSQGIQFLIKQQIIKVPTSPDKQINHEVKIPEWIRTSTIWWIDGKISDNDYGVAIQHLVKAGIIVV